jgi:predicted SprT family Zn-dependent metalloprotease
MKLIIAKNLIEKLLEKEWLINDKVYKLNNWSFKGFDKAVRRLGVCYINRKQIGLSRKMTELRSDYDVRQTILHEIAHAIDTEIRGYSHHDKTWKHIARQIGYKGKRTTNIDKNVKFAAYKWLAVCDEHGILGGWTRKPKDNKICGKCKSKVTIYHREDNRIFELLK